jgi:hypothetical protein
MIDLRQGNLIKGPIIKHHVEAFSHSQAQMMPAVVADIQTLREVAVEKHALTFRAFLPEVIGHFLLLTHEGANARRKQI